MTPSAPPQAVRRWWIDRLRISVIAAVIVVHATTAYVVQIPWYFQERTPSAVSRVLVGVPVQLLAAFGLLPLFLVGGTMAAGSLSRRGPGGFIRARLTRLGIPVAVYVVLVDPLLRWWVARALGTGGSLADSLIDLTRAPGLGPLWFAVALLGFSLVYVAWRSIRPEAPHPANPVGMTTLLLVAAAVAIMDALTWPLGPDVVERYWDFNWPHWQPAAGVFVLGALAGERGWLDSLPDRLVRLCGWLAVLATALLAGLTAATVGAASGSGSSGAWGRIPAAALDGLAAVFLVVWLVGRLKDHWDDRLSAITARAARGSYGAYLLHPVVLVGLSLAVRRMTWPPEIKLVAVVAVGVPVSFIVGYLATRISGINRVL